MGFLTDKFPGATQDKRVDWSEKSLINQTQRFFWAQVTETGTFDATGIINQGVTIRMPAGFKPKEVTIIGVTVAGHMVDFANGGIHTINTGLTLIQFPTDGAINQDVALLSGGDTTPIGIFFMASNAMAQPLNIIARLDVNRSFVVNVNTGLNTFSGNTPVVSDTWVLRIGLYLKSVEYEFKT